jgi:hypothetical protein
MHQIQPVIYCCSISRNCYNLFYTANESVLVIALEFDTQSNCG